MKKDSGSFMYLQASIQHYLSDIVAKLAKTSTNPAQQFEPYQRPSEIHSTVRTPQEEIFYFARKGVFGPKAYLDAILAVNKNPDLTFYSPEYSVANETLNLAEQNRTNPGISESTGIVKSSRQNTPVQIKPYSTGPYSSRKYSPPPYLKTASRVYRGIEERVRGLFGLIRSVYQSSTGVFRNKKLYTGKDDLTTSNNVASMDSYRAVRERKQPQPAYISNESLEQKVAA